MKLMRKAFPDEVFQSMRDSGDFKSRSAVLPYRRQIAWQTRRDHESRQNGSCAVAEIRSLQLLRSSGRCVSGEQGRFGVPGLEPFYLPGLRPTAPPFGIERSGGLPECLALEALPYRDSQSGIAL